MCDGSCTSILRVGMRRELGGSSPVVAPFIFLTRFTMFDVSSTTFSASFLLHLEPKQIEREI